MSLLSQFIEDGEMAVLENRFGPTLARDYFGARELNLMLPELFNSADRFWETMIAEQGLDISTPTSAGKLREYVGPDPLLFRGQSNYSHGISASLHRFVQMEHDGEITEQKLSEVESAILEEARIRGLKKDVSPGELLMILQHHHAPTRLLDVSTSPLEALYFAVERNDTVDGRLFIIRLRNSTGMTLSNTSELPWTEYQRGKMTSSSEWTQTVRVIEERPLDPRMIAQRGRFLVGGLTKAYANLNMWHGADQLRVSERTAISMLCINFPKVALSVMNSRSSRWPAIAWTVRIPSEWKSVLRKKLDEIGINHDSIYPDLNNIQWRAEQAARLFLNRK